MLYEKKVSGERHIFATDETQIPESSDQRVTFLDSEGQELSNPPTFNETYFDDKHGGIIRKSDNSFMAVAANGKAVIPKDWEMPTLDYFCIEAIDKKDITVKYTKTALDTEFNPDIKYSLNKLTWTVMEPDTDITVPSGSKIYFKGINNATSTGDDNSYITFDVSDEFSVSGNITSLLYGNNVTDSFSESTSSYTFYSLFQNSKVVSAEGLRLPNNVLSHCYNKMFDSCENLISAPELPATVLAPNCYDSMFW